MHYYSTMHCELLTAHVTKLMFNTDCKNINYNFKFNKADLPHHAGAIPPS